MEPIAYPTLVVVPRVGNPILIVHDVFEGVYHQSNSIDDVRLYFERGRGEEQPYVQMVIQALTGLGYANGKIGIELGCGYTTDPKIGMPLGNFLRIEHGLPDAKFVDASEILRILRMKKSGREIDCIKRASQAVDKTFAVCFEMIRPGMSEAEVVSICNKILSGEGVRPVWTLAITNPTTILSPRPNVKLKKGMLLFLDLGATYAGYHSDFNRMAVVGRPSRDQVEACKSIAKITRNTIKSIKPGVKASDIVHVCRKEFTKLGLKAVSDYETRGYGPHRKIGHGIGLSLSEAPQVATYDNTIIEPGVTVCIEPPLLTSDGFYVVEQVVAVTADGARTLSRTDDQLYHI